jgi:hypothetical protein
MHRVDSLISADAVFGMAASSIGLFLALALSVAALGVSIITLWFQRSPPDVSALKSRVENVDLDLTELSDRVTHWMRRDATRSARAGRDVPLTPPAAITPEQKKVDLRRRAGLSGM